MVDLLKDLFKLFDVRELVFIGFITVCLKMSALGKWEIKYISGAKERRL